MRTQVISLVIAAIFISTTSGASSPAALDAPFSINTVLWQGSWLAATIPSVQSGTIAGICILHTMNENAIIREVGWHDNELSEVFTIPLLRDKYWKPILLLGDQTFLNLQRPDSIDSDPRSGREYIIRYPVLEQIEDVTPGNLLETPKWNGMIPPTTLWSEKHGLAWFLFNQDTRVVSLWQGKDRLAEVMSTPPVLAIGRGYIAGSYRVMYLTDDGQVLAYDWEAGTIKEVPDFAALGKLAADFIGEQQENPTQFTICKDVIVLLRKDSGESSFVVLGSDGSRLDIKRSPAEDLDKFGDQIQAGFKNDYEFGAAWMKLTDKQQQALILDSLTTNSWRRQVAAFLPNDVVSTKSGTIPIDETHVGIFDKAFQRLTVIGAKGAE